MSATLIVAMCSGSLVPARSDPQPPLEPTVINLQVLDAKKAAKLLHGLYPHALIRVHSDANAVIVEAPATDVAAMRSVITSIDVKNPTDDTVEAIALHQESATDAAAKLKGLFPRAKVIAGPNHTVVITAAPATLTLIHAVLAQFDAPPVAPSAKPVLPPTAFRVSQGDVQTIARALARTSPNVQISVSGSNIIARGTPDDVAQVKTVLAQLDVPRAGTRYVEVYHLTAVDAKSVADLLARSFHDADIAVDGSLNAISVTAPWHIQARIANAVAQLDVAPGAAQASSPGGGFGGAQSEVVFLHAAVPGTAGAASTSATDMAQTVTQALAQTAPDVHIVVQPNSTRLILTGSERGIAAAKALIQKLDVAEPLVELDTEVYEIDDSVQKQLGYKFPTPVLSTTYSEVTPPTTSSGATPRLLALQGLTRTPLTLGAELDFLVSTNRAKILEDPRITTFSGRTASLRAGETVNILTTTGGGTGTVATTQVQSFQTGVTLDITPVVNADDYVTVTLHPSVNSEAGVSAAGVPNIQTRDTTTTVGLHDGETIVVGGLIEDSDSRTVQKVPVLGDLPLVGKLFQDVGVNHTRNELVVTVTPHIIKSAKAIAQATPALSVPSAQPLPTIDPAATLPPTRNIASTPLPASPSQTAIPNPPTPSPVLKPSGTPQASASPTSQGAGASAAPSAVPSAFAQTNTYTFGAAPANNFANANAPPQIFYIQVSPTVVKDGQSVTISVISSSNVTTLSLGPTVVTTQVTLSSIGIGKWQSTFNFSAASMPVSNGNVNELLTATTALGASTSVRIPFTLTSQ